MGRLEGQGLELGLHLDISEALCVTNGRSVDPRCIF